MDEPPNMPEITMDWLKTRLAERGIGKRCPFCEHERWVGAFIERPDHADDIPVYMKIAIHNGVGEQIGVSSEFFTLTCLNCGFTRLHAVQPLLGDPDQWPQRGEWEAR